MASKILNKNCDKAQHVVVEVKEYRKRLIDNMAYWKAVMKVAGSQLRKAEKQLDLVNK